MIEADLDLKWVFIIRGLPGSGKSKLVDFLAEGLTENPDVHSFACCSADFFFDRPGGNYEFNPKNLGAAHRQCMEDFTEYIQEGIKYIFVDNTATLNSEWKRYAKLAKKNGYNVVTMTVEEWDARKCFKRNKHGVPLPVIKDMKERFQR